MRIQELLTLQPKVVKEVPSDGLWFQHQSSKELQVLKPLSYKKLSSVRNSAYPIKDRIDTEKKYKKLVNSKNGYSFLYATIVGKNKMKSPLNYPGYTYFFKLSSKQLNSVIFDIVDIDKHMEPTIGMDGLNKSLVIWDKLHHQFKRQKDNSGEEIDPRIEVVIPFTVIPTLVIPHEEDR